MCCFFVFFKKKPRLLYFLYSVVALLFLFTPKCEYFYKAAFLNKVGNWTRKVPCSVGIKTTNSPSLKHRRGYVGGWVSVPLGTGERVNMIQEMQFEKQIHNLEGLSDKHAAQQFLIF